MRRAGVFVFPSRYEGFGLPPLEAMRLGVPAIVSGAGALPEVCGDGAVQANGPMEIAAEILRLRKDPAARAALIARGRQRAEQFTWAAAADGLLRVWGR
jgi:glycosyltransferase involved in cell wall biosynthesis